MNLGGDPGGAQPYVAAEVCVELPRPDPDEDPQPASTKTLTTTRAGNPRRTDRTSLAAENWFSPRKGFLSSGRPYSHSCRLSTGPFGFTRGGYGAIIVVIAA
jgi:hypothetical protein